MPTPNQKLGLRFTETMRGYAAASLTDDFAAAERQGIAEGSPLEFTVTISTDDLELLLADPRHPARIDGAAVAPALSKSPLAVKGGEFNLLYVDKDEVVTKHMRYAMPLRSVEGRSYYLEGLKWIRSGPAINLWPETTTLYLTVYQGNNKSGPIAARGIARIRPDDFARQLTTIQVL